jgi:hypothetical protein
MVHIMTAKRQYPCNAGLAIFSARRGLVIVEMMDVFKDREILGLGWICHAASSIGGLD